MLSAGLYRFVAEGVRWPCRFGFPGRRVLIDRLIGNEDYDPYWTDAGLTWVESKVHGYDIPCDLRIYSGRRAYYLRRWNEADTQSILLTLLRPGDTCVDIGANVGMAVLTAARAVGPSGRILAFEPNPAVASVLKQTLSRNRLDQVEVHENAIGPEPGRASFFIPASNHGEGSFGLDFATREGKLVQVTVKDGSCLTHLDRCDFIKIDVEGFEVHVIEAIQETIERHRPLVLTEVVERHLQRCDSEIAQLAGQFAGLGYSGFKCSHVPVGYVRLKATLEPFQLRSPWDDCNVLWVPSERAGEIRGTEFASIPR